MADRLASLRRDSKVKTNLSVTLAFQSNRLHFEGGRGDGCPVAPIG
jgi:hypothetical protein